MDVNYNLNHSRLASKPLSLAITYRRVDGLKLDPANPRRHSRTQIRQIANSIEAFGFNVPILIDRDGNVIAGHGRLLACRERGVTEVPTLCLDHLTPAQARAFMIADNRLAEIATWDGRLLAQQFKDLSLLGLDFNIEVTGFEMGEIDVRITSLEDVPDQGNDPADAVPEISAGPRVTKIGDAWVLDRHRVLCGDALDAAAFTMLLGKERAAVVFTDPPYNVPIDGHASGLGAIHHRSFPMASGEMDRTEYTTFLGQAFRNLASFSGDGALHFICMDWRHIEELMAAGHGVYGELKNLCVWVKDNGGMGSLYRSQHELVFVFDAHRNNVQLGQFGRNRSNVWRYPGANSFARYGEEGNLSALRSYRHRRGRAPARGSVGRCVRRRSPSCRCRERHRARPRHGPSNRGSRRRPSRPASPSDGVEARASLSQIMRAVRPGRD
jgi:hypothetical protein